MRRAGRTPGWDGPRGRNPGSPPRRSHCRSAAGAASRGTGARPPGGARPDLGVDQGGLGRHQQHRPQFALVGLEGPIGAKPPIPVGLGDDLDDVFQDGAAGGFLDLVAGQAVEGNGEPIKDRQPDQQRSQQQGKERLSGRVSSRRRAFVFHLLGRGGIRFPRWRRGTPTTGKHVNYHISNTMRIDHGKSASPSPPRRGRGGREFPACLP